MKKRFNKTLTTIACFSSLVMNSWSSIAFCSSMAATASWADEEAKSFEVAASAYRQEHFSEAFQIAKDLATSGYPDAQLLLTEMYRHGLGVPQDEYKAFLWCKKAAAHGSAEALYELAVMYLEGVGVTPNDSVAMGLLYESANKGYAQANDAIEYMNSEEFGFGC